jgi:hypothetical protein
MRNVLIAMMMMLAVTAASQAELLMYEGFDYQAGADLVDAADNTTGVNGGTGFAGSWFLKNSTDPRPTIDSSSLSYGSLQTSGGSLSYSTGRSRPWRDTVDLSSYYDQVGETVYVSYLLDGSGGYERQTFFGAKVGQYSDWGRYRSTADNSNGLGQLADFNEQTNLIVFKMTIEAVGAADDRTIGLDYWFNPADSDLAGSEPGTTTQSHTAIDTTLGPQELFMSEELGAFIDEVRIGTTWADVTPIPEPATMSLLALGGAAIIRRRRR